LTWNVFRASLGSLAGNRGRSFEVTVGSAEKMGSDEASRIARGRKRTEIYFMFAAVVSAGRGRRFKLFN
jgi:hypothetical protein